MYLPQPNKGGKERDKEYTHMAAVIFSAVGNDDTLPSTRRHRRKVESLQIDSTHNVAMETNPKTSKRVDRKYIHSFSIH